MSRLGGAGVHGDFQERANKKKKKKTEKMKMTKRKRKEKEKNDHDDDEERSSDANGVRRRSRTGRVVQRRSGEPSWNRSTGPR